MSPVNLGIVNNGSIVGDVNNDVDVNVSGRMQQVRRNLRGGPGLPASTRAELEDLLAALAARLDSVGARMPSETDRVLVALEALSKELGRPKPDRGFLETAWAGLKNALGLLSDALPDIVGISKKLAALLALVPL
jgi:hypothetical protein